MSSINKISSIGTWTPTEVDSRLSVAPLSFQVFQVKARLNAYLSAPINTASTYFDQKEAI